MFHDLNAIVLPMTSNSYVEVLEVEKVKPDIPYLRVKIISLMDEARTIRRQEGQRRNNSHREGLHNHRVVDVRREQRAALLAYGFLRGKSLQEIEQKSTVPPITRQRVFRLVEKYGTREQYVALPEWFKEKTE